MATSGIRAGALLCRRVPHGSPAGLKPACIAGGHCQVWKNMTPKVRSTRTTSAPLSRIPLMTADHHGRGTTPFVIAWEATVHDALGAKTSVANISSAEGTATTRPCPRRPRGQRRPGSAASDTGPLLSPDARPKIWRRSGRRTTRRTTRHRGTAHGQLIRPRRPVYPRARFRPSSPAGAWSLNSGDSPEIPASP